MENLPQPSSSASDIVSVPARYSEWFSVEHLDMAPEVAGREWRFTFEGASAGIKLPDVPPKDEQPSEYSKAFIHSWRSDTGAITGVAVFEVSIRVHKLEFKISKQAKEYQHTNVTLHDEEAQKYLDSEAGRYFRLAARIASYWIEILRWKLDAPLLDVVEKVSGRTLRGGGLVDEQTGITFWSPRESNTVKVGPYYKITNANWSIVENALAKGQMPPIWIKYFASAKRRVERQDLGAATIELAIAAESAVRSAIDQRLPENVPAKLRDFISRMSIIETIGHWNDVGLTGSCPAGLQNLFDMRNKIMHRGNTSDITSAWCKERAKVVQQVIAMLVEE